MRERVNVKSVGKCSAHVGALIHGTLYVSILWLLEFAMIFLELWVAHDGL